MTATRHLLRGIPFHSQYSDVLSEWRGKACTMACLKMAMEYCSGGRMPTTGDLYEEALAIQASMISKGWLTEQVSEYGLAHSVIAMVARNNGVLAYAEEFKSYDYYRDAKPPQKLFCSGTLTRLVYLDGLRKIQRSIENSMPVIASVKKDFNPSAANHSVLLVGHDSEGFFYLDPLIENGCEGEERYVDLAVFDSCWRRLAIFVGDPL